MARDLRWLVVLVGMAAPTAGLACTAEIRMDGLSQTVLYDVYSAETVQRVESVRVAQTGGEACVLALAFRRVPEVGLLGDMIGYEITDRNGAALLTDAPETPLPARHLSTGAALAFGEEAALEYHWLIERGQVVGPGIFRDVVELRLYEVDSGDLLDTAALDLSAEVEPSLDISLAGASVSSPYAYTMDFKVLQAGEWQEIAIKLRSNEPFEVALTSANNGVLGLEGAPEAWQIEYTATLAEQVLSFPGRYGPLEATSVEGLSVPLRVTIGEVAGKRAGVYRDEITIRIEPVP